jgi:uncharacterized membrane protein HdeD (DUF308 family)
LHNATVKRTRHDGQHVAAILERSAQLPVSSHPNQSSHPKETRTKRNKEKGRTMTADVAQAEQQTYPWWLLLVNGIAAVIIGILLLTSPLQTVVALIQILGLYWLISGVVTLVSIFVDSSQWGWKLVSGILGVIAGLLVLQHPLWSTLLVPTTIVLIIAIQGIIIGVIGIIQLFQGGGWGAALMGVISLIFGILLLARPLLAATVLPFVFGGFAIVGGIAAIIGAFQLRNA